MFAQKAEDSDLLPQADGVQSGVSSFGGAHLHVLADHGIWRLRLSLSQ